MSHRSADEQVGDVVDHIVDRTLGNRLPKPATRQSKASSGSPQMGSADERPSQQQAAVTFRDWAAI